MSNLIVVLIGITFYLGLSHFDLVREKLDMFLSVVAPFIVGFAVAYLLNTPAKFLERELFAHCRSQTHMVHHLCLSAGCLVAGGSAQSHSTSSLEQCCRVGQ